MKHYDWLVQEYEKAVQELFEIFMDRCLVKQSEKNDKNGEMKHEDFNPGMR